MKFFTADQHFGHANIIKYCNRVNPDTGTLFASFEEMDAYMTAAWNSVVSKGDTVYHLGDISKDRSPKQYLKHLNGNVVMIRGNHDYRRIDKLVKDELQAVHDVLLLRPDKGSNGAENQHPHIWLSHYAHRVWPVSYHGSWHLYGHSHSTLRDIGLSMDVGVDTRKEKDFRPYSLAEVAAKMEGIKSPKERNEHE
jgi:calcineurin-like phosphoesterase family protein